MENCFWNDWSPATMHFCEEKICGLIVQPANAYSSLAFILIGFYLFKLVRCKSIYVFFPISAILVGITSFLYHASWTFFFQVFDVTSMCTLSCLMLCFAFIRLDWVKPKTVAWLYPLLVIISCLLMVLFKGKTGEYIFAAEIVTVLGLEISAYLKDKTIQYKYFLISFGLFLVSFFIWNMDVHEIWCEPNNHVLQGHAVWHIMNSFCFYYLYLFYRQFESKISFK